MGNQNSDKIYLGINEVDKVYLGSSLLWQSEVITWEYTIETPSSISSFGWAGGTIRIEVSSYRTKYINGVSTGITENIPFISNIISGTSIFSVNGALVSATQNNTLSRHSGIVTFTQSESGKSVTVSLSQAAGIEGWNYTFSVGVSQLWFDAVGGEKNFSVASYRRQTINGSETGIQESVGYNYTATNGFSAYQYSVTANENTVASQKNGNATYSQNNSNNRRVISLHQDAAVVETVYVIETNTSYIAWDGDVSGNGVAEEITVGCELDTYINGNYKYSSSEPWYYEVFGDTSWFTVNRIGDVLEVYPKMYNGDGYSRTIDIICFMTNYPDNSVCLTCEHDSI